MNDKTDGPDAVPGVPPPDPPKGGPNEDENSLDPADLTPGFGGTSQSRPESTATDSFGGEDKD